MIRFKELLFEEDINENILRSFKNDCAAFLEINSEQLKNGNILKRGTPTHYDKNIVKKKFRKREGVTGNYFNTWLYEKFKPSSYPSREKMIPTNNGKLLEAMRRRDVYGVFPIGRNYKLQYSSKVEDFNAENPYLPYYTLLSFIWNFQEDPERYNLNKQHVETIEKLSNFYHSNISENYDDIVEVYNRVWSIIKNFAHLDIKIKERIEKIKESARYYFKNSEVSKEIPQEQGLEVNLYAPRGFYYVDESVLTQVVKNSIT